MGKDAGKGLAPYLVTHVVRVGKGADDDLALPVGPPTQDHAPAEKRGIPRDDGDARQAGLPGKECRVQRARDKGPERATTVGKLLKHVPDETSRLADDRGKSDGA